MNLLFYYFLGWTLKHPKVHLLDLGLIAYARTAPESLHWALAGLDLNLN
jgi:hypothetical protein